MASVLERRQHRVRMMPLSESGRTLLTEAGAPNAQGPADLLLFDVPDTIDIPIRKACQGAVPIVALDYFGTACPTLTISVRERNEELLVSQKSGGARKSGLEYAIIRKEILSQPSVNPGQGVLVMLGGADVRGLSETIATKLYGMGEKVTVVVGPFASMPGRVGDVCILRNPDNLPELMASTEWAVTSGGVTMIELMYLGKPVHVVAQTEPEKRLATLVSKQAALLGLGDEKLRVYSKQERDVASVQAKALVDGKGAERIAEDIEALL